MYQKIIIIGNLGRDPEMRYTPEGNPVTSFSVATSRRYSEKEETTWFRVTVWGKQAETCNQYLHKGSKVLVEGRLRPDANGNPTTFQRKDGTWGASYEITAETVRFLTPKGEDSNQNFGPMDDDEDIPF
ncbi:MAG TPA: single-stranded DNA-binding protein [Anaerolineaceae bacterium]|jgi:single-strand DNA-binding protein|nr:single-stranded DNA-binding protein [Anaerolineaceae bacterium]